MKETRKESKRFRMRKYYIWYLLYSMYCDMWRETIADAREQGIIDFTQSGKILEIQKEKITNVDLNKIVERGDEA